MRRQSNMKSEVSIFLLVCFVSFISGCPPVDLPRYSSMNCSWTSSKVKQCSFECHGDTDLIGPSIITCKKNAEDWNKPIPICFPDFTKCGKGKKSIKCPKITKEYLKRFKVFKKGFTSTEKDAITEVRDMIRSHKLTRSSSKNCFPKMCRINCPQLTPNVKMVKRCNRCKRKKIIKCSKSGSPFSL